MATTVNGAIMLRTKPLENAVIRVSEPQYRTITGSVVSIVVAPPAAIGAYLSSLTSSVIVTIVNNSRRKLAANPKAPHVVPSI